MKDFYGKDCADLRAKKLWLLDMDGTIYLGDRLFPETPVFLQNVRESGGKFVFVTNNSSRSVGDYVAKVRAMGIDATEKNFFTSSQASVLLLREKFPNERVYAQGTASFVRELRAAGIAVSTEYDEEAACILVGFDPEITGKKMETTCRMLHRDIPYYATNPDWTCNTDFGFVPDCGSMCFGYEKATGRKPIVIGKPEPTMIEIAMRAFGVSKAETVVVGDRLYTDIAAGVAADVDTILVYCGEATEKDWRESEVKPTYVFADTGKIPF